MDIGRYRTWKPVEKLKGNFHCAGVHHDYGGFRILLKIEGREEIIRLSFEEEFLYQKVDESLRISPSDSESQLSFPHPFYIVENSGLLAEFHRQSAHIYEDVPIQHFAIYTCNGCIDVLSVDPPTVEIVPPDAGQT